MRPDRTPALMLCTTGSLLCTVGAVGALRAGYIIIGTTNIVMAVLCAAFVLVLLGDGR